MKLAYLQKPKDGWCKKITPSKQYPRHWIVMQNMNITLSDGSIILIPKGFIWDGASIPKWLWWLFNKIDFIAIWFLIHDFVYIDKKAQLERFNYHIFNTRKFADDQILLWSKNEKIGTRITLCFFYLIIRLVGGFFYSRQFKIPN